MTFDLQLQTDLLARDVDQLRARLPMQTPKSFRRLCRIEAPVSATYNTYNVTFLDGTYTETAGVQSATYADRQLSQTAVAHNLAGAGNVDVGDIVIVKRISDRWWFRVGAGAVTPPTTQLFLPNFNDFNWDETNLQYINPFSAGVGTLHRYYDSTLNRNVRRSASCTVELGGAIPQGSTIVEAKVEARHRGTPPGIGPAEYDATGVLEVQDEGNPPDVTTYTSQEVDTWTTVAGSTAFTISKVADGTFYDVDFTSLLQAVVNRGDFAENRFNFKMTTDVTVGLGTNTGLGLVLVNALQTTIGQHASRVSISWT